MAKRKSEIPADVDVDEATVDNGIITGEEDEEGDDDERGSDDGADDEDDDDGQEYEEDEIDIDDDPPFVVHSPATNLRHIKTLIWGPSGVGKSVLAGSSSMVPEMCPVLHLDIEGGTLSLHGQGYDNVDVARVRSFEEFAEIYQYLVSKRNKYKTVIIDSFTELQKYCMDNILDTADREEPVIKDWGTNASTMRKVIRWLRDLPLNLICICLETEEKDERTGVWKYKPQLPGKLSGEMQGYFDINVRYTMTLTKEGQEKREITTGAAMNFSAKDRTGRLPRTIEEPTMLDIYRAATAKEMKK